MTDTTVIVGTLRAWNSDTRRLEIEKPDGESESYLLSKYSKLDPAKMPSPGDHVAIKLDSREFVSDVKTVEPKTKPAAGPSTPTSPTRSSDNGNGHGRRPDKDRLIIRQNALSHATALAIAANGGSCTPENVKRIAAELETWVLRPVE